MKKETKETEASQHTQNLLRRIESLESQIAEWKIAAREWGCDTPEELRIRITSLPETY